MNCGKALRGLAILGLLGLALALAVACGGGGASQSELDAAKQQAAAKEQEAADLQQKLTEKEKEAADLQQKLAAEAGVTTLLAAQAVPSPTPRPTPTPLPPGVTPPPPATAPAAYDQPVGPFYFYVEVLATTTPSKYNIASTIACTPSSVFKRGQRMVWRFEVIDMSTGKRITDKDEATLKVRLPNGDESTGRFSQRAGGRVPDAPWMWSANWDIPLDYPLGGVDYAIVVTTKDGRTGTFKTPALVSSQLNIDSRPKVVE